MAQQRKEIRIDQLPPQQLQTLKGQLEEELDGLSQSAATLQNVASEFHRSGEAIERMANQKVGERFSPCHSWADSDAGRACRLAMHYWLRHTAVPC